MRNIRSTIAVIGALAAASLSASANASLIFYDTYFLSSPLGDPTNEAAWVASGTGTSPLTYLAKIPPESSPGAVSSAHFSIRDGGGGVFVDGVSTTAEVKWDLTGTGFELRYVLLKDGSVCAPGDLCPPDGNDKKSTLYSLWEVTADQYVMSDWEAIFFGLESGGVLSNIEKGISHVTFLGVRGGTTVPEPSMLTLLGSGLLLLSIVVARRRRSAV